MASKALQAYQDWDEEAARGLFVPGSLTASGLLLQKLSEKLEKDVWKPMEYLLLPFPETETSRFFTEGHKGGRIPLLQALFQQAELRVLTQIPTEEQATFPNKLSGTWQYMRDLVTSMLGRQSKVPEVRRKEDRIRDQLLYLEDIALCARLLVEVSPSQKGTPLSPAAEERLSNILTACQTLYVVDSDVAAHGRWPHEDMVIQSKLQQLKTDLQKFAQNTPVKEVVLALDKIKMSQAAIIRRLKELDIVISAIDDPVTADTLRKDFASLTSTLRNQGQSITSKMKANSNYMTSTVPDMELAEMMEAITNLALKVHKIQNPPTEVALPESVQPPQLPEVLGEPLSVEARSSIGQNTQAQYVGPMTPENSYIGRAVWDRFDEMGLRETFYGYVTAEGKILYRSSTECKEDFLHGVAAVPDGNGSFCLMDDEGREISASYKRFLPPHPSMTTRVAYTERMKEGVLLQPCMLDPNGGRDLLLVSEKVRDVRPWGNWYLVQQIDGKWQLLNEIGVRKEDFTSEVVVMDAEDGRCVYVVDRERLFDIYGEEVSLWDGIPGEQHRYIGHLDDNMHGYGWVVYEALLDGERHMYKANVFEKDAQGRKKWMDVSAKDTSTQSIEGVIYHGTERIPCRTKRDTPQEIIPSSLPENAVGVLIMQFWLAHKRKPFEQAQVFPEVEAILYKMGKRNPTWWIYHRGERKRLSKILGYETRKLAFVNTEFVDFEQGGKFLLIETDTGIDMLSYSISWRDTAGEDIHTFRRGETNYTAAKHLVDNRFFVHVKEQNLQSLVSITSEHSALYLRWDKANDAVVMDDGIIRLLRKCYPDKYINRSGSQLFAE